VTIFLNYGGRFPDHTFYGVLFGAQADSLSDLRRLEGCVVGLSGTVVLYRGRPQIIFTDPSQIESK
jgi:DNA/RNA endonuclease YhcR with UshA esterase domain